MRKLLLLVTGFTITLSAADSSRQVVSASRTDRFNLPAGGTIRLENSFGDVNVDGWDNPEVEVTIVRSSEYLYEANEQTIAQRRLDSVQITAKPSGNDVVISTTYPRRNFFVHPVSQRSDVEISYRIKAPRTAKLIVDHHGGGVSISDMTGDIHATVVKGQITLMLPADSQYLIDAKSKMGSVYSDFEGTDRRRYLLGETFAYKDVAPTMNLYLRVRFGDIMIMKLHGPPPEANSTPSTHPAP